MLAFISEFYYPFIWREATARKSEGFTSLALNNDRKRIKNAIKKNNVLYQ